MSRTMFDSATPSAIPADAKMVAYYLDGAYAWPAADLARFRDAVKVSITVTGHPAAEIADVESGDLTPAGAAEWIRSRSGHTSTIYCDRASLPAVQAACRGLAYHLWLADWTGVAHPVDGMVAVQYASPDHGSGGNYDESLVSADWWYPSPPGLAETKAAVEALAARATASLEQITKLLGQLK